MVAQRHGKDTAGTLPVPSGERISPAGEYVHLAGHGRQPCRVKDAWGMALLSPHCMITKSSGSSWLLAVLLWLSLGKTACWCERNRYSP